MDKTSITAYKKHKYSGPRKNLNRVRAQLKRYNGSATRSEAWRKKEFEKNSSGSIKDESSSCQTDTHKLDQRGLRELDEDYFTENEPEIHKADVSPTNNPLPSLYNANYSSKNNSEKIQPSSIEENQHDFLHEIKLYSDEWQDSSEILKTDNDFTNDEIELGPDTNEWTIKKQLCRCCLAEGTFDSLTTIAADEDISYDDILNSLSIELFPVEAAARGALRGVCGLCAARLRDAHAFRHQVHASDARFRALYTRNCITVSYIDIDINLEETSDVNDEFDDGSAEINTTDQTIPSTSIEKKTENNQSVPSKENAVISKEPAKTPNKSTNKICNTGSKAGLAPQTMPNEYCIRMSKKFRCKKCYYSHQDANLLEAHFKKVHLKVPHLKCEHCDGPSFKLHSSLQRHKLQEHNIDERHKCGACDKGFYTRYQLTKHVNGYHMMGELIKCTKCDFETYSRVSFYRHMFKHKTTKDFHCKYCKKSFLRKSNLKLHERIHTGDKRKACAECGQAFVQKASLNYHMAKYHPEVKF